MARNATIANSEEQPKCPSSVEEWIKKLCYIYTTEYCSAVKRNRKEKKKWNLFLWDSMHGPEEHYGK